MHTVLFYWVKTVGKAADAIRDIERKVREATYTALQNASDDIQSTSRDVVRDWRHKVDFDDTITDTPERIEFLIRPKGRHVKIFRYVDKGTKGPYLITAKLKPMLKFQTGYSARTAPTAKYNQGSGRAFGNWVSKVQVTHPGIKPRLFLETFADELIPSLQQRVQSEISKVI